MTHYALKHRDTGLLYPAKPWPTMTEACMAHLSMPIDDAAHWLPVPITDQEATRLSSVAHAHRVILTAQGGGE